MKNPIVALIFGGPSGEHDVSLVSAKNIAEALKTVTQNCRLLGITQEGQWKEIVSSELAQTSFENPINLEKLGSPVSIKDIAAHVDVAFPICHGPFGEDGKLQQQLEDLGLPYVGSGPLSCNICLDKSLTKKHIEKLGLQQTPYVTSENPQISYEEVAKKLQSPFFVKPASMGSSVGISKVSKADDWSEAVALAFRYDSKVVIEQGLEGKEVECALLETDRGIKVSGITEIVSRHEFYSYEAKYLDPNGAQFIYPAQIPESIVQKIQGAAVEAFKALGCRDYVRADFFIDNQGKVFFNELNTHPGFTNISQFPTLWKYQGLSYSQLVAQMISRAIAR